MHQVSTWRLVKELVKEQGNCEQWDVSMRKVRGDITMRKGAHEGQQTGLE